MYKDTQRDSLIISISPKFQLLFDSFKIATLLYNYFMKEFPTLCDTYILQETPQKTGGLSLVLIKPRFEIYHNCLVLLDLI